jgi:cyanuric acid amidohydrolase
MPQVRATAEAVQAAMRSAHIERPEDVHFVQVEGPRLTAAMIAAAPPGSLASDSPEKSMACSRIASALGVALALGEIAEDDLDGDKPLSDVKLWSSVASTSSGAEVRRNEIVVLGRSARWSGDFTIAHRVMRDALDIGAVHEALDDLGIASHPQVPPDQVTRIAGIFVRCAPARSGKIRGRARTMLADGDIDAQRHVRGAVGAIVAAVCGETAIFVSGGAENQEPDGSALLAIVARKPAVAA